MCQRSRWLRWHDDRVVVDYADHVLVVIDYMETRFSFWKRKSRKTDFAFSYGAQVESFNQKNGQKSRDTVHLNCVNEK